MDNKKRTECLVYTRTCGWMVPIKQMNKGKVAEVKDRKTYKIKE
jgi:anaerobic ribonucleoside-triphosphate reductase